MSRFRVALYGFLIAVAVFAAYSNHFENDFHFDDWHTVTANPYIRNIRNIPKFFVDGRMFSTLPANQTYRPIVSTTLAIDYYLAGGLNPEWFHIDTFIWYLALLAASYLLYMATIERTLTDPRNNYVALFAVALFGLHPVCAETVNYVVQRGEIQSTFGVIAGLVAYIYWPNARKWGFYLVPVIIGVLAKPPALMFMPILFVYVYLFETEDIDADDTISRLRHAWHAATPAFIACIALSVLQLFVTPKSYSTGAPSRYGYWITQPTVGLHYLKSFFLPTELTADTDRSQLKSIFSETFVFSLVLIVFIVRAARPIFRKREYRPAVFGIWWFVLAVLPTSLQPLAEVDNDHRMFFPFVGLTLAVCWMTSRVVLPFLDRRTKTIQASLTYPPVWTGIVTGTMFAILVLCGYGTYRRNIVWHTEESLWEDVTEKSPHNGRGLMNYGLVLMEEGYYEDALDYFHQAEAFTPYYSLLKSNEGIAYGAIDDDANAESHFKDAINLAPNNAQGYYFFARWLEEKKRFAEATTLLQKALELNSTYMDARYLLMQIYSEQGDRANLKALAQETLAHFPGDATATGYLARNTPAGGVAPKK